MADQYDELRRLAESAGINFLCHRGITGRINECTEGSVAIAKMQALIEQVGKEERESCAALVRRMRESICELSTAAIMAKDICDQIETAILKHGEKGVSHG